MFHFVILNDILPLPFTDEESFAVGFGLVHEQCSFVESCTVSTDYVGAEEFWIEVILVVDRVAYAIEAFHEENDFVEFAKFFHK